MSPVLDPSMKRFAFFRHHSTKEPDYSLGAFSEGTNPLSPAYPTRAHLSWTWTSEDAPPLESGRINFLEELCHNRRKSTVVPLQFRADSTRMYLRQIRCL